MGFSDGLNELEIACSSFDDGKSYEAKRGYLQRFSDWYFEIRPFEEKLYRAFRVRALPRLFPADGEWMEKTFGYVLFTKGRGYENVLKLVDMTKQNERDGVYCSMVFTLMGIWMGYKGDFKRSAIFSLMNIFVNYAVGNMRYTRNRALKILERVNGRNGRNGKIKQVI